VNRASNKIVTKSTRTIVERQIESEMPRYVSDYVQKRKKADECT